MSGKPHIAYRVIVPPGWLLLPVRDFSDEQLIDLIVDQFRDLPRDSAGPHLRRLAANIVEGFSHARQVNVIDVILPLGTAWVAPISTSIALAVAEGDDQGLGDEIETEAGIAVRTRLDNLDDAVARIEYVWRMPSDEPQLLVGVFSIVGEVDDESRPIVEGLIELCDMILSTLRWEVDR